MVYVYRCEKCDKEFDVELDMQGLLPKHITCLDESCLGPMSRVWAVNAVIPEHMKASSSNSINYEKRQTIHKKSFGSAGNY